MKTGKDFRKQRLEIVNESWNIIRPPNEKQRVTEQKEGTDVEDELEEGREEQEIVAVRVNIWFLLMEFFLARYNNCLTSCSLFWLDPLRFSKILT